MSKSKRIDLICMVTAVFMVLVTVLFLGGGGIFLEAAAADMPYVSRIFDTSRVHTVDIVADEDDWQEMLSNAMAEEYISCALVIDGESYKNVGIRPKGNTSLSTVANSDSDRYSFKIEFDHYDSTSTYYGLDKLCLNNVIQDNTYMKDYLCYQMMAYTGAETPLTSYVWITVNGEDWGLYIAAEGVEESFAERTYGSDYGAIYKPDSMSMGGGGRGAEAKNRNEVGQELPEGMEGGPGGGNSFGDWKTLLEGLKDESGAYPEEVQTILEELESGALVLPDDLQAILARLEEGGITLPEELQRLASLLQGGGFSEGGGMQLPDAGESGEGKGFGGMAGMGGSSDVLLVYTDESYDSYPNIFDNAVFDVTNADKDRLIQALKNLNEGNIEESVNVDEVISYFVAHNFVLNGDSYTGSIIHNYYLHEDEGLLSMIAWDYNLAFGGMGMGAMGGGDGATSSVNSPIDSPVSSGELSERPMVAWIFENDAYTQQYHEAFDDFISSYFESGYFEEFFEETLALISPYVEKDPTAFCTYEEFLKGADTLKEFCLLRAESIRGQLDGSIPSTSEGQTADSSALIDASHLTVSDMGSQGMGGGNGMGFGSWGEKGKTGAALPEEDETERQQEQPENKTAAAGDEEVAEKTITVTAAQPAADGRENQGAFSPPDGMEPPDGAELPNGEGQGMQPPENGKVPEGFKSGGKVETSSSSSEASQDSPADSAEGESGPETEPPAEQPGQDWENWSRGQAGVGMPGIPGSESAGQAASASLETGLLLGVSALFLAGGLIFAKLYR